MPTLLQLDSSPLESSVSRELIREYAAAWRAANPNGAIIYRDLAANPPSPIDANWVSAQYTPEADRTPEQSKALASSEELIGELERADEYVIGVAMHNFNIPSVLKLWIDQIVLRGRTFLYGEKGPQGLLKGKKVTIVVASGGAYEPGSPIEGMNHIDPYLKTILAFIGLTDVKFIRAGGVARMLTGAVDRQTFLKPTLELVRSAAVA